MTSCPPSPPHSLDVLLLLEQIDADASGEKTKRKLIVLNDLAAMVRDHALAGVAAAIAEAGLKAQ